MQGCIPVTTVCMGLNSPLVALTTQQLPRDLDPGLVEQIPAKEGTERASRAIARDWVEDWGRVETLSRVYVLVLQTWLVPRLSQHQRSINPVHV